MSRQSVLGLAALLMLCSCASSPQPHYYTLSVMASTAQSPHSVAVSRPLQVAAVHMPDTLDRREMVRHTGPNTLAISEDKLWSAPLGEMTRHVLSQDLARLLPGKVIAPEAATPPATSKIVVAIAEFAPQPDGQVVLAASWSLLVGDAPTPALRRDVSLAVGGSGGGAAADAAAMSELLGQLAAHIAATLAQPRR
jgi:uncharacterized lipoprotein YmbA